MIKCLDSHLKLDILWLDLESLFSEKLAYTICLGHSVSWKKTTFAVWNSFWGRLMLNHLTACSHGWFKTAKTAVTFSPARQPVPPLPRHHLQVNGCVKPEDLMMRCQPQWQLIFPKVVANDDIASKSITKTCWSNAVHLQFAEDAIFEKISKKMAPNKKRTHYQNKTAWRDPPKKPSILLAPPRNHLRESSRTVRRRSNRSASGSAAVGLWSTPVPEVTQLGRWTPGATEDAPRKGSWLGFQWLGTNGSHNLVGKWDQW